MSDLLNIGITGLAVSKKSLETTGHNLANANTEGYSRQRVQQVTNTPVHKEGLIQGTGAQIKSVNRVHDQFLEDRLNGNISKHKFFGERSLQLAQVEDIFNEIDNEGLNQILNRFYNSFRELSSQPENETVRSVVRDNAKLVVKDFKRIRETLDGIAYNIDKSIAADIQDVNQLLENVAQLNKNIVALEATGDETGDLRDQRDLAIRNLSEYFDVTTYTDDKGYYIVAAKGVGTLVTGGQVQELTTGNKSKVQSSNNMPGSLEIFLKHRPNHPVTARFSGGKFSSMIEVRNNDLQQLQKNVDRIAFDVANSVNAIHRRGYVNRKVEMDSKGNPVSPDSKGPTTGINFFKVMSNEDNAASLIDLSDDVKADLSNVVTALDPNSPGDNRISLAISKLQHEKVMDGGTVTIEEKYLQTIGNIGLESGKARFDTEQAEGILAQTKSIKERLSGVSIDEETANMMRYQQAYSASARVMRTADEMFKTVLGILP